MIFLQRRLKQDIVAAESRLYLQHEALRHQISTQMVQVRERAAGPDRIAAAFVAGFIFERLNPGWNILSSAAALSLSLFEHKYLIRQIVRSVSFADAGKVESSSLPASSTEYPE